MQLLSFAVEAAKDEVGILIDGTGKTQRDSAANPTRMTFERQRSILTAESSTSRSKIWFCTASTLPAFAGGERHAPSGGQQPHRHGERRSHWPAVWVSGIEIRLVHNWVGVQSTVADREWLPVSVQQTWRQLRSLRRLLLRLVPGTVSLNPGGIQIAGPSSDVFVLENEIENSGRNGITLGSFSILDNDGNARPDRSHLTIPGPLRHDGHARDSGNSRRRITAEASSPAEAAEHPDQAQSYPQHRPLRDRPGRILQP